MDILYTTTRNLICDKLCNTYMETLRNTDMINSLYMAIEINRLSLKADGVFRTITHNRIPQIKNKTSTKNEKNIKKNMLHNILILK